jgi:hypothetical protein
MDPKAEFLHLNRLEIVRRRMLQTLGVAWREADLDAGRQAYDDAVAPRIIMRALGPRPRIRASPRALAASNCSVVNSTMELSPCMHQCLPVAGDKSQDAAGFTLVTANNLPALRADQVDHNCTSRSEHMDTSGWIVVRVDHDPQAIDAQDRGYASKIT